MNRPRHGIGWGVLAGLALSGPALAADYNLKVTVDGVQLGKSVMGPSLTKDDLKGHVVLLKFWGIN
jgi:hypothetical protein